MNASKNTDSTSGKMFDKAIGFFERHFSKKRKTVMSFYDRYSGLKKFLAVLGSIIGIALIITFLVRFVMFYLVYGWVMKIMVVKMGIDPALVKIVLIPLTFLFLWVFSVFFSSVMWGFKKNTRIIASAVVIWLVLGLVGYNFSTRVNFDPKTGESIRFYLKTTDGFKTSSVEMFDTDLGARYKAITPEVSREMKLYEKNKSTFKRPQIVVGKFFNKITGENLIWYIDRGGNEFFFSALPGYDEKTGDILKPLDHTMAKAVQNDPLLLEQLRNCVSYRYDQTSVVSGKYTTKGNTSNELRNKVFSLFGVRSAMIHESSAKLSSFFEKPYLVYNVRFAPETNPEQKHLKRDSLPLTQKKSLGEYSNNFDARITRIAFTPMGAVVELSAEALSDSVFVNMDKANAFALKDFRGNLYRLTKIQTKLRPNTVIAKKKGDTQVFYVEFEDFRKEDLLQGSELASSLGFWSKSVGRFTDSRKIEVLN